MQRWPTLRSPHPERGARRPVPPPRVATPKPKARVGFFKGSGTVHLTEQGDGTLMKYEGEIQIGGKLVSIGQRLIDMTSKTMIRQGMKVLDPDLKRANPGMPSAFRLNVHVHNHFAKLRCDLFFTLVVSDTCFVFCRKVDRRHVSYCPLQCRGL
ncbi:MAG: SRPBCC domain-containing protein [Anaerolineales bacterium]